MTLRCGLTHEWPQAAAHARAAQRQRRVLHVAQGESVGPICDQDGSRFLAPGGVAEKPRPEGVEAGVHPIARELVKNGVRRQGAVLPHFLGQFTRFIGQRADVLGQFLGMLGKPGFFLA